MTEVRIKLKFGPLEVEFEGTEAFAADQLFSMIKDFSELEIPDVGPTDFPEKAFPAAAAPVSQGDSRAKLSTTDFAAKMGAKSGPDLLMAAAASLHHTQGREDFRRSDLLNEMKSARAFYRASYGSNLSKSLDMLVKSGRLQNPKQDTFALPYSEIENTARHL